MIIGLRIISPRLFLALAWTELPEYFGRSFPYEMVRIRAFAMPAFIRIEAIEFARADPSAKLYSRVPLSSQ